MTDKTVRIIKIHKHEIILSLFILFYIIYFTTASFLRHDNFYSGRFDLGNMDQTVWNTAHGRIFQFTDPNGTEIISRLAFHADFILIALAPFYWIWSNPKMLLLLQTVVLATGAVFIYLLGASILKNKGSALLFSLAYLLNPSVQHANLYDFHAVTFATTFLLASYYYLFGKRYFLFMGFLFLAALTKEQVWLIALLFGCYLFLRSKRIMGTTLIVCAAFVFYYLVWHAIPAARGGGDHFALAYYSEFGSSPWEILLSTIASPLKTLGIILQQNRLHYLYQLLLPLGFLPILHLQSLVFALPDLALNFLSNNTQLQQIYFHYTATITPFLFVSAIYGSKSLHERFPKVSKFIIYCLLFTASYSAYAFGPLPGAKNANVDMFTKPQSQREEIAKVLTEISQEYTVAATNNIGAHLSHREKVSTIPNGMNNAEILAFLLTDQFAQPSLAAQREMVERLKQDPNFRIIHQIGEDLIVFQRVKQR